MYLKPGGWQEQALPASSVGDFTYDESHSVRLGRLTVGLCDVVDHSSALTFADMPKTSPGGHAW
jgi:hypothetical protein